MPYIKPEHTLNQVDRAGAAVARGDMDSDEFSAGIPVFYNWREAHAYPQNTLYLTLRSRAKSIDPNAIVSQRLKRRKSVLVKLMRNTSMQLSQMQDIGGCRAIMPDMVSLARLMELYAERPIRSEMVRVTNYIKVPRPSGYRGIHLMYRFRGRASAAPWDRLRVEMQFRTALQHAWATAVEAVDLFTWQRLKADMGDPRWLSFFANIAAINARQEQCANVPGCANDLNQVVEVVRDLDAQLHALETLESFTALAGQISTSGDYYWYIVLTNAAAGTVAVEGFKKQDVDKAQQRYKTLEEEALEQVVLVSAESVAALEKAYPAYFADTMAFVENVRTVLAGDIPVW